MSSTVVSALRRYTRGIPVASSMDGTVSGVSPSSTMHECPKGIAVCCHQNALATHDPGKDLAHVVGQHPRHRVLQAFAAGRLDVVGSAPEMDLILAPAGAGVVLVQSRQIAVIALVQRLVLEGLEDPAGRSP